MARLLTHNTKVYILKEIIRNGNSINEDDLLANIGGSKDFLRTNIEPLLEKRFIREFKAYGKTCYMIEQDGRLAYEHYAYELIIN